MNWLLLRGLGREQRHWRDFPAALAACVGSGRVHLLDVAGVGTQHRRLPRPSIHWLARDVARRLPKLPAGADERWSLLGLSLGGMLCLELCALLPDKVQQAVIINASSRLTQASARLRPAALPRLLQLLYARDAERREQLLLELTSSLPLAERMRHAELAASFVGDAPVRSLALINQLLAAARFSPPAAPRVRARLLFLASRNDALVNPVCTRALARYYGASSAEHPSAGHDLPLDAPLWLRERLTSFGV
jgi:pimeloyl-[acyl-carrier protein] methyl ester esterase